MADMLGAAPCTGAGEGEWTAVCAGAPSGEVVTFPSSASPQPASSSARAAAGNNIVRLFLMVYLLE